MSFLYNMKKQFDNIKNEFDGTNNKEMAELTSQLLSALSIAMKGRHTFLSFLNLGEKNYTCIFEPKYTQILSNKCPEFELLNNRFIDNGFSGKLNVFFQ